MFEEWLGQGGSGDDKRMESRQADERIEWLMGGLYFAGGSAVADCHR
jgi:hypothetical protein